VANRNYYSRCARHEAKKKEDDKEYERMKEDDKRSRTRKGVAVVVTRKLRNNCCPTRVSGEGGRGSLVVAVWGEETVYVWERTAIDRERDNTTR